jgi:hypothetical protein
MIPPVPGSLPNPRMTTADPARPHLTISRDPRQIGATGGPAGLARAHLDLARAEGEEIGREVGRGLLLGLVAFACAFMLVFLVVIGSLLFVGSWLFGSMGWGILHGALLLIAIAVYALLAALRVPGLGVALAGAFVIGLFAAILPDRRSNQ